MNNEQMIKQAYVRGLAARGILRMRAMQKQAAEAGPAPAPKGVFNPAYSSYKDSLKSTDPSVEALFNPNGPTLIGKKPWSRGASDALAGASGAGIGAIIGALVAYARKKKILGSALAGAGIGGLVGVGGNELYRYLTTKAPKEPWRLEWELSKLNDNPLPETDKDRATKAGIQNFVEGLHDDPFSDPDIYNQVDPTVSAYTA